MKNQCFAKCLKSTQPLHHATRISNTVLALMLIGQMASSCGQSTHEPSSSSSSLESAVSTGRVVQLKDRTMISGNEKDGFVFGKGYWEGFISLKVSSQDRGNVCYDGGLKLESNYCQGRGKFIIMDALGVTWTSDNSVTYKRLALPVSLYGIAEWKAFSNPYDGTQHYIKSKIYLESIQYEITKYIPIKAQTLKGKADQVVQIAQVASDIPGTKLSFSANLKTFDNFASGSDCTQVLICSGLKDKRICKSLTASSPTASFVDVPAPVEYRVEPSCQSSRVPQPANKDVDFELAVSDIAVGDPVE